MADKLHQLIVERMEIGRERYSHGLMHESNKDMNFHSELIEELLDAVIYAAANVIKNTPQISTEMAITEDGNVNLKLQVNYELDDDGRTAIIERIMNEYTKKYEYVKNNAYVETLLVCIFALESVLKLVDT